MENYFEGTIAGLGTIYSCRNLEFDKVLSRYIDDSNELISARDLAFARVSEPKKINAFSRKGSYVKEGSLFVPNSKYKRIWLRESLVLPNASDAVNAHSQKKEYFLSEDFSVDKYLEQIGKNNYFIVSDTSAIPTNRFGEDPRTVWAFQDQAKEYGLFLQNKANISQIKIFMNTNDDKYIDNQGKSFVNQLWLRGLNKHSNIDGYYKGLAGNYLVRGVRRDAKNTAEKNYSITNIIDEVSRTN